MQGNMENLVRHLRSFQTLSMDEAMYYCGQARNEFEKTILDKAINLGKVDNQNFRELIPSEGDIMRVGLETGKRILSTVFNKNAILPMDLGYMAPDSKLKDHLISFRGLCVGTGSYYCAQVQREMEAMILEKATTMQNINNKNFRELLFDEGEMVQVGRKAGRRILTTVQDVSSIHSPYPWQPGYSNKQDNSCNSCICGCKGKNKMGNITSLKSA